jgi:hypothetical protein
VLSRVNSAFVRSYVVKNAPAATCQMNVLFIPSARTTK